VKGFEYGNTRLRAWRSRLLGPDDYAELTSAGSIDQVLGALSDTPYGPDVEDAVTRLPGVQRLDEALRLNLSRTMRTMRSFYDERPGAMVQLLLDRWDLHNLRTLLRLPEGPLAPDDLTELLVPAGSLDDPTLRELAALPDAASRIDLLVAWDLPSATTARLLLRIRPGYRVGEDPAILEWTVGAAFAARLDEVLGDDREGAAAVLRAGIDAGNLLTALRMRAARIAGESVPAEPETLFLPAGAIDAAVWPVIAEIDDAAEAAAAITARRSLPGWDDAVSRWADHQEASTLAADLQRATARAAMARFVHGDPLGFDIPLAFTFAKETEVRNLRLIGRGITHGIPASEVAELLEVAA
jgi:V/A-type H+/Na+-transporting ATPase subunit C